MEVNTSDRLPCPKCKSERGLALFVNEDGPVSGYCFSCEEFFSNPMGDDSDLQVVQKPMAKHDWIVNEIRTEYPQREIPGTAISLAALKYFGIRVGLSQINGQEVEYIYAPREDEGRLVGYQVKKVNPKQFYNLFITDDEDGDRVIRHKTSDMYGTIRAKKLGSYQLVIVEGPLDAAAAHQMLLDSRKGSKYEGQPVAVVSTTDGAGSLVTSLAKQRTFIESHKELVFALDMDDAGQEAVKNAVKLTDSWDITVKVASLPAKDARDCLDGGLSAQFAKAVLWNASKLRPKGAVSSSRLIASALKRATMGIGLPWPTLSKRMFGLQPGSILSIGGGFGIGKSTFMTELICGLIDGGHNPGLFYFEEDFGRTMKMLASRYLGKNLSDPELKWTDDEALPIFNKIDQAVQIADVDVRDWEDCKDLILKWVLADGLSPIILDPITKILPPCASEAYELVNRIYDDCGNIGMQHGVPFVLTSHLNTPSTGAKHEEGGRVQEAQFTGSRSIARWSTHMIGLERDKQADGEPKKGVDEMLTSPEIMCARILKNRVSGWTGPTYLEYNLDDRSLLEV